MESRGVGSREKYIWKDEKWGKRPGFRIWMEWEQTWGSLVRRVRRAVLLAQCVEERPKEKWQEGGRNILIKLILSYKLCPHWQSLRNSNNVVNCFQINLKVGLFVCLTLSSFTCITCAYIHEEENIWESCQTHEVLVGCLRTAWPKDRDGILKMNTKYLLFLLPDAYQEISLIFWSNF